MKMLILALILISPLAKALPVLNENAVTNGSLVTLWPDDEDKNLFYYAPSSFETLHDSEEDFITAYPSFKVFALHKAIYNPALEEAVLALKLENPDAVVKPVQLTLGRVSESSVLSEIITKQFCTVPSDHGNGACMFTVKKEQFRRFEAFIATGVAFQIEYKIVGVVRADGEDTLTTATYGIPLWIKGVLKDFTDF